MDAPGGAGVQTAQLLIGRGVDAVLTGNAGPKAHAALDAGGVKIYTGTSGTVSDALEQCQRCKLNLVSGASPFNGGWGGGQG
ncbi:MAG: NifB/NifX family molybdenum-iron cluster-binding protein [Dethiobacteria bacterium]|jgi:predicted Fe-Mo cluster-binding NifX family protein